MAEKTKKKSTKAKSEQKKGPIPTLLMILDGFGLLDIKNRGNAVTPETAPNIFQYMKDYGSSQLKAHGKHVGLFPDQAGNSEAGHLNIGAGRIIKQDLVTISEAIEDHTFFKNESFHQAILHAKKYKSAVHVMGLLTDGDSAHAFPEHLYALLEYFRQQKFKKVYIHIFTDGRDSTPHSAINYLKDLEEHMNNGEQIATVTGRFYAMDRNKLWDRTEKAFNAIVNGEGIKEETPEKAVASAYNRGENDEYIQPTIITKKGKPVATIKDNDAIFFFNARSDRARQLTKVFVQKGFRKKNPGAFKRKHFLKNIKFVAMTDFGPDLPGILTAFPSPDFPNCLAKAIGEEYNQLFISETEKYGHVTFFINGGYPEPINGEKRELIKSTGHYTYARHPKMQTGLVTEKILDYLKKGEYNFFVANFPNADMVGHTGEIFAAREAVSCVDENVSKLVDAFLKKGGQVVITADHGNAEVMIDEKTDEVMTEHTSNPVPFIVIRKDIKKKKLKNGILADVAPTLLKLMGIKKPKEMTGKSLI